MTIEEFQSSLALPAAPDQLSLPLKALWADANGDWHAAHQLAQDANSKAGDWVHAYLHRKEGDHGNASYWYRRAGKSMPEVSLEAEWAQIARQLLEG
jgi:hypothetical protein